MRIKSFLLGSVLLLCASLGLGQAPQPVPAGQKVYATGRVAPPNLKQLYEASFQLYGQKLKNLPKVTAQSWDCRTLGLVGPVQDQGQCGSCWLFSGVGVGTSALYKAGAFKNDGSAATYLSEQMGLDCFNSGGCNGDDNTTVMGWLKSKGMVTQADYGPYHASSGRCKTTSAMKLYQIKDWGFCTTSNQQGVATVQDIKNAMVAYGPIGSAIAADNAFANNPPGKVFVGRSHSINHDIVLVGWQDDASIPGGGWWILRNSWGEEWCEKGYCKIAYGANDVGTEAIWALAEGVVPPIPPTPPTPPTPTGIPVVASMSATTALGSAYTFQITATNNPTKYDSSSLPTGLSLITTSGVIAGTPTVAGTYTIALLATNASGTGVGSLTLTVGSAPVPPGPVGDITITLTPEQVQKVLTDAGAIPIRRDMPMSQFIELLNKCKATPAFSTPMPQTTPRPPTPQVSMPQRLFDPFSFASGVMYAGKI